ncbi:hypothetical protein HYT33_01940 [Candidatus Roizmanbacteria bacterium]|nr:hypothetical protein [Candidatus Roizmanbacteria bacterium]
MPVKKIVDTEMQELYIKAAIVGTLIVLGVATAFALNRKQKTPPSAAKPQTQKEEILGGETKLKTDTKTVNYSKTPDYKKLETQTKNVVDQVIQGTQTTVQNVLGQTAEKAKEVVVQSASQGIVSQIEKLPKDQQEELKNNICKPN